MRRSLIWSSSLSGHRRHLSRKCTSKTRALSCSPVFAEQRQSDTPNDSLSRKHHDDSGAQQLSASSVHKSASSSASQGPVTQDEEGAMTRRLQDLSSTDLTGTRKEDIDAAGFSEDLKNDLLERISASKGTARSQNPSAFAVSEAPSYAGAGSRDIAAAQPWTGTEAVGDAALRMLDDAHKRVRVPPRAAGVARPPSRVDTGRPARGDGKGKSGAPGTGTRLANARDRSSIYGYLKDDSLSQQERDKMRKELKERFSPGARPMPTTLQGLASLANERIEDAIARGQFKNLPSRGKKIERDYNASSPFLDTTEYFMNKIIQKQEIVPPWIERQQELVQSANRFRSRLRADWRRHAARMIASAGGDLDVQMRRAERYAAAEMAYNPPPKRKEEKINTVDTEGHMSQISVAGELKAPPPDSGDSLPIEVTKINVTPEEELENTPQDEATASNASPLPAPSVSPSKSGHAIFRDPDWERTESSYHNTAIKNLNDLTRTYNLMAPDLAKKPYFNLNRELRSCYADVAPTLPHEIKERALGRVRDPAITATQDQGVLQSFGGGGHIARVRDEDREKAYGFKQFWRDIFGADRARG